MLTVWIMAFGLVCVSCIPIRLIQKNAEKSAKCLLQRNTHFYNLIGEDSKWSELRSGDSTKVDQIADAKLLSIAYYIDPEKPLETVLWSGYYDGTKDGTYRSMNESFAASVANQLPANSQYLRYWHGSLIFVRPLLLVFSLKEMKVLHGVVILSLLLSLLYMLMKSGYVKEAVSVMISMFFINLWIVPQSLEYTWMFMLMLAASIVAVRISLSMKATGTDRFDQLYILFFLTGMFAAYLDFFTTETITVLIPLLLSLRILDLNKNDVIVSTGDADTRECKPVKQLYTVQVWSEWAFSIKACVLWAIGYVLTWAAKWVLASLVLNINALKYVRGNFWIHLGVRDDVPAAQQRMEAIHRNLAMLLPFGYRRAGILTIAIIACAFIVLLMWSCKFRTVKHIRWKRIVLYIGLGSIVYVRYAVLRHHSWYHYFFTYRAQAAVILAVCFAVFEMVDIRSKREHIPED